MSEPIPITVIHKSLKRKQIWGECDEATRTIWVERKHPNSQALLGTLVHEAIHLIVADAGNPDWPEEKVVGKCCIAHLHRPGVARGRRLGGATGHCVGTLANIPAMAYAKIRKARTMWNHGFAYGEYCGGKNAETVLWIVEKGKTDWRMPL